MDDQASAVDSEGARVVARIARSIMKKRTLSISSFITAFAAAQLSLASTAAATVPQAASAELAGELPSSLEHVIDSWGFYGSQTGVNAVLYELEGPNPTYQIDIFPADTGYIVFTYVLEFLPSGMPIVTISGPDVFASFGGPDGNVMPDAEGILSIGEYADEIHEALELVMAGPGSPLAGQTSLHINFQAATEALVQELAEAAPKDFKEFLEWDKANGEPGQGNNGGGSNSGSGGSGASRGAVGQLTWVGRPTHKDHDLDKCLDKCSLRAGVAVAFAGTGSSTVCKVGWMATKKVSEKHLLTGLVAATLDKFLGTQIVGGCTKGVIGASAAMIAFYTSICRDRCYEADEEKQDDGK